MVSREKSQPLTRSQKEALVNLINEREIINDKSHGFAILRKKHDAWEAVAAAFNSLYPRDAPKTIQQLKRAWEYIRRVKKNQSDYIKSTFKTGGGPPPLVPKKEEYLAVAADSMSAELQFAVNQLDSMGPLSPLLVQASEIERIETSSDETSDNSCHDIPSKPLAAAPETPKSAATSNGSGRKRKRLGVSERDDRYRKIKFSIDQRSRSMDDACKAFSDACDNVSTQAKRFTDSAVNLMDAITTQAPQITNSIVRFMDTLTQALSMVVSNDNK